MKSHSDFQLTLILYAQNEGNEENTTEDAKKTARLEAANMRRPAKRQRKQQDWKQRRGREKNEKLG